MTIDAHQHFWHYHPEKHEWIDDGMAAIRKDFLPVDLQPLYFKNSIDGCVAVQADETEAETDFLIALSKQFSFVKAVVGFTDLNAADAEERLVYYSENKIVKGFRHVLQAREPAFMLQPSFLKGIALLKQFNYSYDILIFPKHLEAAIELVGKNPNQLFVVDHLAKPIIKAGLINEWKKGMQRLAEFENVYCKLSGMVTETNFHCWHQAEFSPYLDVVSNAFGTKRIMYGSDWPVCLAAAAYENVISIVRDYFASYTTDEQADIFGNNAARFYDIENQHYE